MGAERSGEEGTSDESHGCCSLCGGGGAWVGGKGRSILAVRGGGEAKSRKKLPPHLQMPSKPLVYSSWILTGTVDDVVQELNGISHCKLKIIVICPNLVIASLYRVSCT